MTNVALVVSSHNSLGFNYMLTDISLSSEGGASQGFYVNDGTRDVGSTPTQILLLRGLDALTNEEEILAALSRIGGRASGAVSRGGVKKIYITKDRASRQSWGFAFVQFSDVKVSHFQIRACLAFIFTKCIAHSYSAPQLATDVLASAFNASLHPSGFRIRNRILALSFTHENSFIPIYAKSDWSFKGDGGQQLAYWDDKGFVQPWLAPAPSKEELEKIPKGPKADEDAKIDKDMLAFLGELEDEDPEASGAPSALSTAAVVAAAAPAALPTPGSIAPISIKPMSKVGQASTSAPTRPAKDVRPQEIPSANIIPTGPSASLGGSPDSLFFFFVQTSPLTICHRR
jgi:RNA-binding protein 5/10